MRTPKDRPPDVNKRTDDLITETRQYKVITPLFGGGTTPGEADPVTVLRATEVRGHLRFWWRATRGGQFAGSLAHMKGAEEAIWGSAASMGKGGPSPISLSIDLTCRGTPFQATDRRSNPVRNVGHPSSIDSYAAFPLRDRTNPVLIENVEFHLEIAYPRRPFDRRYAHIKLADEVEAAIWAWETFGGIGARTRRGFGAISCTHINGLRREAQASDCLLEEIAARAVQLAKGEWHEAVPHLSPAIDRYRIAGNGDPIFVWRQLIGKLRSFRQARPGFHRSYWPEPDEIRRRTGTHKPAHEPIHPIRKFPRAAFGLPIVFEFKRGDVPPEPWRTTLQGAKHERLASPLILRPIVCADGLAVGLATILEAPIEPPGGWLLKEAPVKPSDPPIEVTLSNLTEANAIKPLEKVGGEPDVLLAFLKSL